MGRGQKAPRPFPFSTSVFPAAWLPRPAAFYSDTRRAEEAAPEYCAGGKKITAKLVAEALRPLPDEKRKAVLPHCFFDMTDAEIAELMKIPRSTVQYRRTGSFELLKNYPEEHADEYDE